MGDVINLAERRDARRSRVRRAGASRRAEFFFDLASPFTYLAAERVDRAFEDVVWTPASSAALLRGPPAGEAAGLDGLRRAAEERAAGLRLPLSWPERFPAEVPASMRVAARAAELGRAGNFVLAAARLAFCGGFDLEDPEILAEASAAAGIVLDDCLTAARDGARDGRMEAAARRLLAVGAERLPALRVGRTLHWGEDRVSDAALAARTAAAAQG
jgi:2-hydroxychromene-2-carboxylate isomerase